MLTTEQLVDLRKLRLWHFRQMRQAQETHAKRKGEDKKAAAYWQRQVDFHSMAVECLNPMFDVGDAASSDDVAKDGAA